MIMRILRILAILLLSILTLGNRGCVTTDTVILPEGPRATELSQTKDQQIAGLTAQVKAEIAARQAEQDQASLAAADFETILFAATHLSAGLPRNAIEEEAKLGKARSPAPNAAEVIKGKDRIIAILNNDVAAAQAAYGKAFDEAAQAKAQIAAKDQEIGQRDAEIAARQARINQLTEEVKTEKEAHANDVRDALAKKDKEMTDYKKAEAEKERRWLINATRLAALGLVVVGAIALAAFRMIGVGAGLAGAGVLVGLISIGIETLTAQPWWPYLCGTVFVFVVAGAIYGIYRLWIKHELDDRKTKAIQDMIDEATIKGDTGAVEELKTHLAYRMGDKQSFWGKRQAAEVVKLGLIDPKGEAALKTNLPPT